MSSSLGSVNRGIAGEDDLLARESSDVGVWSGSRELDPTLGGSVIFSEDKRPPESAVDGRDGIELVEAERGWLSGGAGELGD